MTTFKFYYFVNKYNKLICLKIFYSLIKNIMEDELIWYYVDISETE